MQHLLEEGISLRPATRLIRVLPSSTVSHDDLHERSVPLNCPSPFGFRVRWGDVLHGGSAPAPWESAPVSSVDSRIICVDSEQRMHEWMEGASDRRGAAPLGPAHRNTAVFLALGLRMFAAVQQLTTCFVCSETTGNSQACHRVPKRLA